jgi:hypothetical protein
VTIGTVIAYIEFSLQSAAPAGYSEAMDESGDRRSFLRGLASQAARGVQVISPLPNLLRAPDSGPSEEPAAAPTPPVPAAATTRFASLEELSELACELELESRLEALRALAEPSARLSLGVRDGDPVAGFVTGSSDFSACVDLAIVAKTIGRDDPASGLLWVLAGGRSEPQASVEVQTNGVKASDSPPEGSRPLHASAELLLPRPWSPTVTELELTQREQVAWQRLRQLLAQSQGVETADTAQREAPIHRVFGFADETPTVHPPSQSGRMLLQLSPDPMLGWSGSSAERRLYVWTTDPTGGLEGAQALIR